MGIDIRIRKKLGNFVLDIGLREEARRIGILGASGCGKSMLLKSVAGIVRPDEGHIIADGQVFFDSSHRVNVIPQRRRVGYLFQNYALFPSMSVEKNIGAGLGPAGDQKKEIVAGLIQKFGLSGMEKRLPGELSGGQQQRVALARIMAYRPGIILLDEPFSALDAYLRDRMQAELMEMTADYAGIMILVSHSRDEIYRFSDRLVLLDRGKVVGQGNTKEIFRKPKNLAGARLTGCKNLSRAVRVDDHRLYAEGWGVELETEECLPRDLAAVAYRAHDFIPIWGAPRTNCIPFRPEAEAELPFEKNFYVRPDRESYGREDLLTWFVPREEGERIDRMGGPDFLQFEKRKLMILT